MPKEMSGPRVITQNVNFPLASKFAFAVTVVFLVAVKPPFSAASLSIRKLYIPIGTAGFLFLRKLRCFPD